MNGYCEADGTCHDGYNKINSSDTIRVNESYSIPKYNLTGNELNVKGLTCDWGAYRRKEWNLIHPENNTYQFQASNGIRFFNFIARINKTRTCTLNRTISNNATNYTTHTTFTNLSGSSCPLFNAYDYAGGRYSWTSEDYMFLHRDVSKASVKIINPNYELNQSDVLHEDVINLPHVPEYKFYPNGTNVYTSYFG